MPSWDSYSSRIKFQTVSIYSTNEEKKNPTKQNIRKLHATVFWMVIILIIPVSFLKFIIAIFERQTFVILKKKKHWLSTDRKKKQNYKGKV